VIISQQHAFELPVSRVPVLPAGYPECPSVLGEHIKKTRIDKGFTQAGLAALLGADESTVWNWEHGRCPTPKHMPLVVRFLGYDPFPPPDPSDVYACLKHIMKLRGWTFRKLGKRLGIHFEQIQDWMAGRSSPSRRNIEKVDQFLAENLTNPDLEGTFPRESTER
jgi:transcriptional regulator with XRE-family HTH domain